MDRKRRGMDCREFEETVIAFSEGTLPQEMGASLEEHRRECDRCATLAATIEQMLQEALPAGDVALSQEFWPALYRRVQEHDSQAPSFLSVGLRPAAATIFILLAAWVGVRLGNAYAGRAMTPTGNEYLAPEGIVPYVALLDEIPHDSLTELWLQESLPFESEQ